ncbi:hypothetical protein K1719_033528 [Acacia pycnantha]|nr:hypothetical protein K1719_033528 [Acacia pycnantha]
MALELVGGAVLGVLFDQLRKEIWRVKDNSVMFKPKLEELEETLTILYPVIEEIEELNIRLNRPNHGTETISLRRLLEDGTKLVSKCSKIPRWDIFKQGRYREKLVELDNKILRFHNLYLQAHMGRDQKQTLLFVQEMREMMIMSTNQQVFSNLTMGFTERNLLADTAKIFENNKFHTRKDDLRKIVTVGLSSLGYDCYICKCKSDKSHKTLSYPAGEYEYIEVIVESKRLFIDIDFRSEFELDRSTGAYRGVLQSVPIILVGKSDRLCQFISTASETAKGMHFPPLRKPEFMLAKLLSSTYILEPSNPRDLGGGREGAELADSPNLKAPFKWRSFSFTQFEIIFLTKVYFVIALRKQLLPLITQAGTTYKVGDTSNCQPSIK